MQPIDFILFESYSFVFFNTKTTSLTFMLQVRPFYQQGAIEEVVDENIGTNYNTSSVWKVAEIAMACVQFEGRKRPTMNKVCNELMEALRLETSSPTMSSSGGEYLPFGDVKAR